MKPDDFDVPGITLAYLIEELKPLLQGAKIIKIQELPNHWLKIRFRTPKGERALIFAQNKLFITSFKLPAKQQSSGFGAFLNKRLKTLKLERIQQHNLERLLMFEFNQYKLVFELFGEGNLILCDEHQRIVMPLKSKEWGVRSIKKGQPYIFPPSLGVDPRTIEPHSLAAQLKDSKKKLVPALVSVSSVAPVLAEEAAAMSKLQPTAECSALTMPQLTKLCNAIRFLHVVDTRRRSPALFDFRGKRILLPFSLSHASAKLLQSFESVNEAIDVLVASVISQEHVQQVSTKVARLEHAIKKQYEMIDGFERAAEESRKKGEAIFLHYQDISKVVEQAKSLLKQKKPIMYKISSGPVTLEKIDVRTKTAFLRIEEE
jgi:predicted ribosome quality control (RQC) complex YloA/Tae2 family protein